MKEGLMPRQKDTPENTPSWQDYLIEDLNFRFRHINK